MSIEIISDLEHRDRILLEFKVRVGRRCERDNLRFFRVAPVKFGIVHQAEHDQPFPRQHSDVAIVI